MSLYNDHKDQIKEYERIFQQARDDYLSNRDPRFLQIQIDCLRSIKFITNPAFDPSLTGHV